MLQTTVERTDFGGIYKTVDSRLDKYGGSCVVSCPKNSKRRIPPTRVSKTLMDFLDGFRNG